MSYDCCCLRGTPDMTNAQSSLNLKREAARRSLQLLIRSAAGLGASTLKPAVANKCTSVTMCCCWGICTRSKEVEYLGGSCMLVALIWQTFLLDIRICMLDVPICRFACLPFQWKLECRENHLFVGVLKQRP